MYKDEIERRVNGKKIEGKNGVPKMTPQSQQLNNVY